MSEQFTSTVSNDSSIAISRNGGSAQQTGEPVKINRNIDWAACLADSVPGIMSNPNYSEIVSLYGKCSPLFDLCSDNAITSFCNFGTYNPLLDLLNFTPTNLYTKKRNFITYVSNEGAAAGSPVSTYQGELCCDDGCGPGPSVEFGTADYECKGFDEFKVSSPVRKDVCENIRYCEAQPVYTIDGTQITNNDIWDMMMMSGVIVQDMHRWTLDKLRALVNYGYVDTSGQAVPQMDACVVDWAGQGLCPEDGVPANTVSINGTPTPASGFTFIETLETIVRRNRWRVNHSPNLPNNGMMTSNAILVLPFEWIECLLRCYVCHRICGGDVTRINNTESRMMLDSLRTAGQFGMGSIDIYGVTIDFLAWDFGLIDEANNTAEMFLLHPQIGNQRLIDAEFNDMRSVAQNSKQMYDDVTDGGLLGWYSQVEHGCYQSHGSMYPRMCMPGPWAQTRFIGVPCEFGAMKSYQSCDPLSPFYIGGNTLVKQASSCDPCTLQVTKTPDVTSAGVGDTVTYTVVVSNFSGSAAQNVSVSDTIPAGASYVASSISGTGADDSSAPSLSWSIPSLASGASETLIYQVTADAAGTVSNTVNATADNTATYSATASVTVA